MNEIQSQRINNPSRFFARAQPDSVFTSQQLWTVDYQTIKDTEEGIEIITTTTSIPSTVASKVKEAWETVFTSKKHQSSWEHEVFKTKSFKSIRNKIKNKDTTLTQETTILELNQIIKKLSSNTATGPDNIPNEIIKILFEVEQFQQVLLKIINTCIYKKRIPKQWKQHTSIQSIRKTIQIILLTIDP